MEYNQTRSREDILIAGLGGEDFAMEDIITGEMDISPSVRYYENDEMIEDQTGYEEGTKGFDWFNRFMDLYSFNLDFSQRIDQLYSINLSTVAAMRQSFFDTSTEVIEKSAFDLDASASKKHTNLADVLQRSCQLLGMLLIIYRSLDQNELH